MIIFKVSVVIICGQSKFSSELRLVYAIFDVNFKDSDLDVIFGTRGLNNNYEVIAKVGLNLLLSSEVVSFMSQLRDNLKGLLKCLSFLTDWANHDSLEWYIFIFIINLVGKKHFTSLES